MPLAEAEVVANQRAGPGLAAGPRAVDDESREAFRGRIDRRGQAARAGADHDHVELPLGAELRRDAESSRRARRSTDRRGSGRRGRRGRDPSWPTSCPPVPAALRGGRTVLLEPVGNPAAGEQAPQLVDSKRPLLANQRGLAGGRRMGAGPLVQELGEQAVEALVRACTSALARSSRSLPSPSRPAHPRRRWVTPAAPVDQQDTLRERVQVADRLEERLAGCPRCGIDRPGLSRPARPPRASRSARSAPRPPRRCS